MQPDSRIVFDTVERECNPIIPALQASWLPLCQGYFTRHCSWELGAYLAQALTERVIPGSVELIVSSNLFFWGRYVKGSRF